MGLFAWMKEAFMGRYASDTERFRPRIAERRPVKQDPFADVAESIRKSGCGCYRHGARDAYERHAYSDERKFRVYRAISDKLFSYCDTTGSSTSDSNTPIVLDALRATMREARRGNLDAIAGLAKIVSDLSSCAVYWDVETSPEGANYGPQHGLQLSEAKEMFDAIGTLAGSGNYEAAFHLRSSARPLLWYFDSAYDSKISDNEQYLEREIALFERYEAEAHVTHGRPKRSWEEAKESWREVDGFPRWAEWVVNLLRPYADQVDGMLWAIEHGPTYRPEAFQQVIHADLPLWEKAERLRPLANSGAVSGRIDALAAPPALSAQDALIAEFKRSYDHKRAALGRLEQERLALEKKLAGVELRWGRTRSALDAKIGSLRSLHGTATADLEDERSTAAEEYLRERDKLIDAGRAVHANHVAISLGGEMRSTSKPEAETNRKIVNRTLPKAEYLRLRKLSRTALFAQRQTSSGEDLETGERVGVAGSRRER